MKISTPKLMEKIGFSPTEKQQEILDGMKRTNVVLGARRTGKTMLISFIVLRELLANERQVWVVAPTYSLAKNIFHYVFGWVTKHFPDIFDVNRSEMTIKNNVTGSLLELKTAESESSLKGKGLSLLVIEEAADISKDIYETYLRPNISENRPELGGKKGKLFCIGNAPFSGHWFHSLYKQEDNEKFSYHLPAAVMKDGKVIASNNPDIIDLKELQKIYASTPSKIWEKEWLAKILNKEGWVFKNPTSCISGQLKDPEMNHHYQIGLDVGRNNDFTVITTVDLINNQVVNFQRFTGMPYSFIVAKVEAVANKYHNATVICDSTGMGDPVFEQLRDVGLNVEPYKFNNTSKKALIENLVMMMEKHEVSFPDIAALIDELSSFSIKQTPSGMVTYEAPTGQHDDCVISLALACHDLNVRGTVKAENMTYDEWHSNFCKCHNHDAFRQRIAEKMPVWDPLDNYS